MISQRERGLYQIFILVQTFCFGGIFLFGYGMNDLVRGEWNRAPESYLKFFAVVLITSLVEGVTRPEGLRHSPGRRAVRILRPVIQRQVVWLAAAMGLYLAFSRDAAISRWFIISFFCLVIPLAYVINKYGYQYLISYLIGRSPHWRMRTLVLGPADWLHSVLPSLEKSSLYFALMRPVEYDEKVHTETLLRQLECMEFDLCVLPHNLLPAEVTLEIMNLGDRKGFRCWLPLELSRNYGRHFTIQRVGTLDVLTPPAMPLANTFSRMTKRVFDIGVSLFVIPVILLPLMLLVKCIQQIWSPGPMFFRQTRMGENGRAFQIIKFRTMSVENDDETRQAQKSDPRVYKGGNMLRRLSLDEFPQFINVLRGEMSVVGPRPHMVAHELGFERQFHSYGLRRHVKPGVTGLAQTRGYRGEITKVRDVRGRARLDLLYIRNWSLILDIKLVIVTILQVLLPHRNAY